MQSPSSMVSSLRARMSGTELVFVLGAGGHGKVVADALSLVIGRKPDGFIDSNQSIQGACVMGLPVLADPDWLFREGKRRRVALALGIGDQRVRQSFLEKCLANDIRVVTVIHPDSTVAASASIGVGSVVLAQAVVNADARIGRGAIINTAAIIEHDVEIGDFSHVAPNAATGGRVRIGAFCQIGLGAQILPNVSIDAGAIVGAGAVVRHDLPESVVAAGNPARILRLRTGGSTQVGGYARTATATEHSDNRRIFLSAPHMSGHEEQYLLEAIATNWVAPVGPHIDHFEREFSAKLGIEHAVAVSSGTAAMHLAMRHLDLKPGEEVFCSTATFAASVNPVVYEGGTPVFIDSDPDTWNIDCDLLAEELARCDKRGKLPRAVIAVDLYGQCADWEVLREICQFHKVPLVEDAAESLGATYRGKPAGTFGWANVFSFNGNKIITTSGGGMLATADGALAAAARRLATQARDPAPHYEHTTIGYNYRLSNLLAGVGRAQLCVLENRVAARRSIFEYYREALEPEAGISFMPEAPYGESTRWLTCILIEPELFGASAEDVRAHLEAHNIEARPLWKPMHLQPVFKNCRYVGGTVAERLFEKGLCLPSGSALTKADLHRVVSTLQTVPRRRIQVRGSARVG